MPRATWLDRAPIAAPPPVAPTRTPAPAAAAGPQQRRGTASSAAPTAARPQQPGGTGADPSARARGLLVLLDDLDLAVLALLDDGRIEGVDEIEVVEGLDRLVTGLRISQRAVVACVQDEGVVVARGGVPLVVRFVADSMPRRLSGATAIRGGSTTSGDSIFRGSTCRATIPPDWGRGYDALVSALAPQ